MTGASRGIGAGIAERLAAEGADVAITARTLEHHPTLPGSLRETAERLERHGARVHTVVADLTDEDQRGSIVPDVTATLGPVDILVNNAAAAIYQPLSEYPAKRRRLMLDVNLHTPIELTQAVLPDMIEQGEGWVVNVSSGSAEHSSGPPFRTEGIALTIGFYGATKAALNRVTNAFAVELYGRGVRVNTIEPRAAVLSEGAHALVGDMLSDDQIESLEAMVEATISLCDCDADTTGSVFVSLDLLDARGIEVQRLDGQGPYPGGFRVYREEP
ncbi:MAG: SDR family NAD(P)-dependent oxidoreductase [Acidimicrobiales bacterium]